MPVQMTKSLAITANIGNRVVQFRSSHLQHGIQCVSVLEDIGGASICLHQGFVYRMQVHAIHATAY